MFTQSTDSNTPQEKRQVDWDDGNVKGMRGQMAKDIEELSVAWRMGHSGVSHFIKVEPSSEDRIATADVISRSTENKQHMQKKRIPMKRAKGKVTR